MESRTAQITKQYGEDPLQKDVQMQSRFMFLSRQEAPHLAHVATAHWTAAKRMKRH